MADLNKVTDYILNKASEESEKIKKEADAKYKMLMEQAEVESQNEYNKIINDAQSKAGMIKQRAESEAEKNKLQGVLALKNKIVKDCILSARESVYKMDDSQYFALIERIFKKCEENSAKKENPIIEFNERDLKRLPESFKNLVSKKGYKVSETPVDIDGGFVLKYGKIEENCSVSAIFRDKEDYFTDYIGKKLFS